MAWQPYEPDTGPHRTQETRRGNWIDDLLRTAKPPFELVERKGDKEPIWKRRDKRGEWEWYRQSIAVLLAVTEGKK